MTLLHLVNRLLAVVLSIAVVVAAVLLATEVVRWALDQPPWVPWHGWGDRLLDLRAGDAAVLVASSVAVGLGLLLLLFELKPRRSRAVPSVPLVDGVETLTTRRGLRSAAETAALGVTGVRAASVDVGRRSVRVKAHTRMRGLRNEVQDGVTDAVTKSLYDLELERTPKVRVSVEEEG